MPPTNQSIYGEVLGRCGPECKWRRRSEARRNRGVGASWWSFNVWHAGGEFRSRSSDSLEVEVCVSSTAERSLSNRLASQTDEVRAGLPAEYVAGVLNGIALAKGELGQISAGKLLINCAAHGRIGSSKAAFKHLAAILVKLFNMASQTPTDLEPIKLFPSTFNREVSPTCHWNPDQGELICLYWMASIVFSECLCA
jgi:hypothetical protein